MYFVSQFMQLHKSELQYLRKELIKKPQDLLLTEAKVAVVF